MKGFLIFLLFCAILLLIIIVIYYVYIFINRLLIDRYNKLIYNHKNIRKKYRICPKNCDKGECDKEKYCGVYNLLNNNCCSFGFQCKDCVSNDGKIYSVPADINKYNNSIIDKINKKIKEVNRKREEENIRYENEL